MGQVIVNASVSVDGYIADLADDVGRLHDWYFQGDTPLTGAVDEESEHSDGGSGFRVSRTSAAYVRPMWESIGVIVMGRHLFDLVDGWEGRPPAGEHVVVVSHRPMPDGWHPEASYHFADSVPGAIARAQELAGDRVIAVTAGNVGGQVIAAGLADEVAMDVVPVVFGGGKRFFGSVEEHLLLQDPSVVVQGERVLHLRYEMQR